MFLLLLFKKKEQGNMYFNFKSVLNDASVRGMGAMDPPWILQQCDNMEPPIIYASLD